MRHADWTARLDAFLLERVGEPFSWGRQDCCLFAADAVRAITGADLAAGLRGYGSAAEAARLLAEYGGVQGVATARLGAPIDTKLAQRGDVVMVENAERKALAVCVGATWIGAGERALVVGPMEHALMAWRV